MIEKQLTDEVFDMPESNVIEEPKLIPKIKPEQVLARPIFKSKYERFEWHLKNGCTDQTDRKWFENYKESDEFRQIYGDDK